MPEPITAGIAAVGSIGSGLIGSKSAKKAAAAETQAAQLGIAEQRAAREELRKLLAPYTAAGTPALQGLLDLAGLGTDVSQRQAIEEQEESPLFQALARQGEEAILQQASATGGLRGGNVQGALAQFRPSLLNQFIEQQYSRLGGIASLGQQSAAGVGTSGIQSASNISQLLGNIGSARAGGALASGQAWGNVIGQIGTGLGAYPGGGAGLFKGLGF